MAANRLSSALVAEFIGTFALVFIGAGAGALGLGGLVGVALAHGLTVMVMVYAYGDISGAHVNPAVTFGVWMAGKMDARRALSYWFFQLLGGVVAAYALLGVLGGPVGDLGTGALAHDLAVGGAIVNIGTGAAFFLEALFAFFLATAVLFAAVDKRGGDFAGVAVGATLVLNILMGGPLTGAIFNPARQLGPALASGQMEHLALYLVAPLVGGGVAAVVYRWPLGTKAR
jgi:MIP family channel proteins